jgi:hypothetical protein
MANKSEGMFNRILGSIQAFWDRYTNKKPEVKPVEAKSESKPAKVNVKAKKKSKKKKL